MYMYVINNAGAIIDVVLKTKSNITLLYIYFFQVYVSDILNVFNSYLGLIDYSLDS